MAKSEKHTKSPKTTVRIGKFAIIGIILALFNFVIYTFLARVIFNSNELLWLDSIISYGLATILAYILHSKITWKERNVTKHSIIRFFIWNALLTFIINPGLTQLFSLFTPLYNFAYSIISALHLPFSYEFTLTTGAFVLTAIVTMILNFLFYDRFVFGKSNPSNHSDPAK